MSQHREKEEGGRERLSNIRYTKVLSKRLELALGGKYIYHGEGLHPFSLTSNSYSCSLASKPICMCIHGHK